MSRRLRDIAAVGSILVIGLLAEDWIASAALAVLFIGWKYLSREHGPPIVAAAFSSQWLQVTIGILYFALTGRQVVEMQNADYRPMVLLGLGCIVVLFTGFFLSARFRRLKPFTAPPRRPLPWSTNQIAVIYLGTVAAAGILQQFAWSMPGLTQVILVFSRVRYVFLFFLVTRLVRPTPRWTWIGGILVAEVGLGFTGFFADFREPLVIVAIALFGTMDRRKAGTWLIIGSIGALAIGSAVVWTAVKPFVRKNYMASASSAERLNMVLSVAGSTFSSGSGRWTRETDHLVSRAWAVYFASLALSRVPSILPHERGEILRGAVANVLTPRMLFPEKPILPSQSDEVRKYSGIWVEGRESSTSYAFGYAGESYVDFGIPLMFLPILALGLLLGFAYRWLDTHISHDELRTGVIIVIFWSTLSLYEASWVMIIGPFLTNLIVLGGGAVLLDRILALAGSQRVATITPGVMRSSVKRI